MKYLTFSAIIFLFLFGCSRDYGTDVEVNTGSISGCLFTRNGTPNTDTVIVAIYKIYGDSLCRKIETSSSFYVFDSLPEDEYRIEVRNDDIVIGKTGAVAPTIKKPHGDTIHIDEVITLGFTITSNQSDPVIAVNSLIENSKVKATGVSYIVKTIKAREFTFKMIIQKNGITDTVDVKTTIAENQTVLFDVVDSPVEITLISNETKIQTGAVAFTFSLLEPGTVHGVVSYGNLPITVFEKELELQYLIVKLSAPGADTTIDTIPLSNESRSTINKVFGNLAPATWTLDAATFNQVEDSLCHQANTTFTVPLGDTVDVPVVLTAHCFLKLSMYNIPVSTEWLRVRIDENIHYTINMDSIARDSLEIMTKFASPDSGDKHHIALYSLDPETKKNIILFSDTTIVIIPGEKTAYQTRWLTRRNDSLTEPVITFEKTYGGRGVQSAYSVLQNSDGGYIVAAVQTSSSSPSESNFLIIKTNANGDSLWSKTFSGNGWNSSPCLRQTKDGGYIVAGSIRSRDLVTKDVFLAKTDSNGTIQWTRTFGGDKSDYGYDVQQTRDGGYIITGETESFCVGPSDFYLVKTNANGDSLWTKTFGGRGSDRGTIVQETTEGGFIIAGYNQDSSRLNEPAYLYKTNADGDSVWAMWLGEANLDSVLSMQQTADGGYIVGGFKQWYAYAGICLVKINQTGEITWTKDKLGGDDDINATMEVRQTKDGALIVIGQTLVTNGDVYFLKTDSQGNVLWTGTFGGTGSDIGYDVQQTNDGGYIMAGVTDSFGDSGSEIYLIKTDAQGSVK